MAEKICPKCKSENVKLEMGNPYGSQGNWLCKDCGYHNQIFPEKEIKTKGKQQ